MDITILNQKILTISSKLIYRVSDLAPGTFEDLKTAGLVVWAGASDNTIYGDATVNHAFRAWHDSLHLELNAPFTLEGEILVARTQANRCGSDKLAELVLAEVIGQAEYFKTHGEFPLDQKAYITELLEGNKVITK